MYSFGFAEVIPIVSACFVKYLLLGMRSLFLRSACEGLYIASVVNFDSCTLVCVLGESDHSIRFPVCCFCLLFI